MPESRTPFRPTAIEVGVIAVSCIVSLTLTRFVSARLGPWIGMVVGLAVFGAALVFAYRRSATRAQATSSQATLSQATQQAAPSGHRGADLTINDPLPERRVQPELPTPTLREPAPPTEPTPPAAPTEVEVAGVHLPASPKITPIRPGTGRPDQHRIGHTFWPAPSTERSDTHDLGGPNAH